MIDYKEEYEILQKASDEYEEELLQIIIKLNKENEKLQKENKELKRLCDALDKEHNTTFKQWLDEIQMYQKDRLKMNKYFNIFEDCVKKLSDESDK